MIDPDRITNYHMTPRQLEENLLFWVLVAFNNAKAASRSLDKLLRSWPARTPFASIRRILRSGDLAEELRRHGVRCYRNKAKSVAVLANSGLDLRTCTYDDLLTIPGIGDKTASCFLLHSRRDENRAGLDVHVRRFLSDLGHEFATYEEGQRIFLSVAAGWGESPAALDQMVWSAYSSGGRLQDVLVQVAVAS